jgi:hypothetical protein
MVQSINEILDERGTRYGIFINQARIAQTLALAFEEGRKLSGKTRFSFDLDELEALSMIFNKIARITNGDPHYSDSWRDIAGYATLVADRLDNDTANQKKLIEDRANAQEQYERNRTPEQIEANRADNESSQTRGNLGQVEDSAVGDVNRPTGQSELRRLPVRLQVQDGIIAATTETQPGVSDSPRV